MTVRRQEYSNTTGKGQFLRQQGQCSSGVPFSLFPGFRACIRQAGPGPERQQFQFSGFSSAELRDRLFYRKNAKATLHVGNRNVSQNLWGKELMIFTQLRTEFLGLPWWSSG